MKLVPAFALAFAAAAFAQGSAPPIPHPIDGYLVTRQENNCLECHDRPQEQPVRRRFDHERSAGFDGERPTNGKRNDEPAARAQCQRRAQRIERARPEDDPSGRTDLLAVRWPPRSSTRQPPRRRHTPSTAIARHPASVVATPASRPRPIGLIRASGSWPAPP